MQQLSSLKIAYQQAINRLPWSTHQVSLLLDGINTPNILKLLYNKSLIKQFDLLYINTRFSELKEVSPCLISLPTPESYPIQTFIEHLSSEWGYILTSQKSFEDQVGHLRKLLIVEDPTKQQLLLKLADPLVMPALLTHAIKNNTTALFGPFSQILSYDIIEQKIIHLHPPSNTEIHSLPEHLYTLTEQESQQLDQVDIKRANQKIYNHMKTYFQRFMAQQQNAIYTIDNLIAEAEAKGYTSIQEQIYYLNIHGYLGLDALKQPQVAQLIAQKNIESLKEAAKLAEQIAEGVA